MPPAKRQIFFALLFSPTVLNNLLANNKAVGTVQISRIIAGAFFSDNSKFHSTLSAPTGFGVIFFRIISGKRISVPLNKTKRFVCFIFRIFNFAKIIFVPFFDRIFVFLHTFIINISNNVALIRFICIFCLNLQHNAIFDFYSDAYCFERQFMLYYLYNILGCGRFWKTKTGVDF